jgi:hypothetical protein
MPTCLSSTPHRPSPPASRALPNHTPEVFAIDLHGTDEELPGEQEQCCGAFVVGNRAARGLRGLLDAGGADCSLHEAALAKDGVLGNDWTGAVRHCDIVQDIFDLVASPVFNLRRGHSFGLACEASLSTFESLFDDVFNFCAILDETVVPEFGACLLSQCIEALHEASVREW